MAYGIKDVKIPVSSQEPEQSENLKQPKDIERIVEQVLNQFKPDNPVDSDVITEMVNEVIKKYQMN